MCSAWSSCMSHKSILQSTFTAGHACAVEFRISSRYPEITCHVQDYICEAKLVLPSFACLKFGAAESHM